MNENWETVYATGHGVWDPFQKRVERKDFIAPRTAQGKGLGKDGIVKPTLRIIAETSGTENHREEYWTGENFNLGVERKRQSDELRNEIYAKSTESLKMRKDELSEGSEWGKSLEQIFRVIEAIPVTILKGRVYACDDGEIGIVWGEGNLHIEISVGVSEHIEYLVLDEDNGVREESVWIIESGDPMPETLASALRERS